MKRFIYLSLAVVLIPAMASAQVIVNDSWASGTRTSPPNDAGWWTSTGSTAIEVGTGFLGLVSGASGRGIHGTFASQTLNIGDMLTATFTFTTPATVTGAGVTTALRAGFFDTTGKPGLAADITASTGSPNAIYNNLSGYMTDFDVNTGAAADIAIRERSSPASGQLLATTADYTSLGNGGTTGYAFAANTAYTGILSVVRTADGLDITSSLYQGATLLSSFTASDLTPSTTSFGMLAFHVGSNTFGSSSTPNNTDSSIDNGINFSNIQIEYLAVPEPSTVTILVSGGLFMAWRSRRRSLK